MNAEQIRLHARLEAFCIDDGEAPQSFTDRLAKENGWSEHYAQRVVVEYKRFLLLAATAGHPVTPSEDVDQVWHLHLCSTRSYWDRLCNHVLGRPLHHNPTQGGAAESRQFVSWYRRTLASYEAVFGEAPPADVWPEPSVRFGSDLRVRRVNVHHNLIVPRVWLKVGATSALLVVLAALALAGWHPFALSGTGFLVFYSCCLLATGLFGLVTRQRSEQPDDEPTDEGEVLTPCDLGYLADGEVGATNVAITAAVARGVLRHQGDRLVVSGELPDGSEPLEHAVVKAVASGGKVTIAEVRRQVKGEVGRHESTLVGLGLLSRPEGRWRGWLFAVSPLLVLLGLGMIRLCQGLERGRPVAGLVTLLPMTVVVIVAISCFKRFRSGRGERLLGQFRQEHAYLKSETTNQAPAVVALGVALFGIDCLRGGPLEDLGPDLWSSASRVGSGDGGCSGGGDGGCGGGGCGGGCGGCGGCGG